MTSTDIEQFKYLPRDRRKKILCQLHELRRQGRLSEAEINELRLLEEVHEDAKR